MHRSRSLAIVALLVGVAVGASALSALLPPEEIPSYATPSAVALSNALVFGEWIVTFLWAVVAIVLLGRHPRRAAHLLAAGLYALAVGIAFVWYGLSAFGGDDAGLGPAFFGAPLVLLSGIVAIASSSVVVAQRRRQGRLGRALGVATFGATLTIGWLLLRGRGDWQGAVSATRLHGAPIVLAVGVVSVALSLMDRPRPPRHDTSP